jgi:hypothetical protein
MERFYKWINQDRPKVYLDSMIIVTDTAGFDASFVNFYLSKAKLPSINFLIGGEYRISLDSHSFCLGVGLQRPVDGVWGSAKAAVNRLNIPEGNLKENPFPYDHNPVNDAANSCWEFMFVINAIRIVKQVQS